jgi:MarR family 2-MHQ and catechol resistance regulon transcriptional repressor
MMPPPETDGVIAQSGKVSKDRRASRDWSEDQNVSLRLWIALARCYGTFSRAVATRVGEYGLTMPQFGILEALHHLGPLTLGDLAQKLLVTGGNITYVMDRLEEQDLVARERSGDDRRVVWADLTPKGRDVMLEVFPDHVEVIFELTDVLDPEERQVLRGLLRKLGRGIAEGDEPPPPGRGV